MEGAGQGSGRTEGACVQRGQGGLKGAACAFTVPAGAHPAALCKQGSSSPGKG